jgi:hypothetical protein
MAIARALLATGGALAGLAAFGWAGIALLVVATDPACDTAGCDNAIGVAEYIGVGLLAASGTVLLIGAILTARSAQTHLPRMASLTTITGIAAGIAGLSLF